MAREPIHPGEFLADELAELGISATTLARTLHVPPNRIYQISLASQPVAWHLS